MINLNENNRDNRDNRNNLSIDSSEITNLQKQLIGMGFRINMINKILSRFQINNLEQAVDYLVKSDGMWNHPFVSKSLQEEDTNNNNNTNNNYIFSNIKNSLDQGQSIICEICNDLSKFHRINLISSQPEQNKVTSNFTRRLNSHKIMPNSNIKIELQKAHSDISLPTKHKTDPVKENSINKDIHLSIESNDLYLKDPCQICFNCESDLSLLVCQERFCKSCISEYLCNKINNSEVEDIKCPNHRCSQNFIFPEDLIKTFINQQMFDKYKIFLRKVNLLKNPNIILCPIPDCDSYGYKNINCENPHPGGNSHPEENIFQEKKLSDKLLKQNEINIDVNFCRCLKNHEFCLKCNNFSHPGMECELKLEKDFHKYVDAEKIKNCPQCKFFIKKFQGCNHIVCGNPICKYEFCWICMEKYDTGHYTNALTNCYQLQYADESDFFVRIRSFRILRCILIWLGRILISLVCLVFPTLVGVCVFIHEEIYHDRMGLIARFKNESTKRIFKLFYSITVFLMGIYLISAGYFCIILAVVTCPVYSIGCFFLHYYLTRVMIIRLRARQNLHDQLDNLAVHDNPQNEDLVNQIA